MVSAFLITEPITGAHDRFELRHVNKAIAAGVRDGHHLIDIRITDPVAEQLANRPLHLAARDATTAVDVEVSKHGLE